MNESSLVLLNRASMLVLKGLIQDALGLLEKAILEFPFDPRPLERAAELHRGLGRNQEAVLAYLAAGDLYAQAGSPLRALDLCKRVLEIDPQNSKAHRVLKNAPPPRNEEDFLFDENGDGATVPINLDPLEFESTSVTQAPVPDFEELTPTAPLIEKTQPKDPPTREAALPTFKTGPQATRAVPVKKVEPAASVPSSPNLARRSAYSLTGPQKIQPPPEPTNSSPRLPSIPLFAELPPRAFREVLGAALRRRFRAKEVICREGEPGKSCFIILSGEALVWKTMPTGRQSIATLGAGEFFGEMASLSQLPRSATVEATKETETFEIPWDVVARLAQEHKPVEAVLHRFYKRRVLDNLALSSLLFGAFTGAERELLVRSFVIREAKVGDRLLMEGVHASGFFVLLSVGCEMTSRNKQNKPVVLQKLRAGDFFGSGSILENRPALVTVVVTEAGRLLHFPRKAFFEVMQNHAAARAAVAPLLAERRYLAERVKQTEALSGGRIEMP